MQARTRTGPTCATYTEPHGEAYFSTKEAYLGLKNTTTFFGSPVQTNTDLGRLSGNPILPEFPRTVKIAHTQSGPSTMCTYERMTVEKIISSFNI